MCIGSKRMRRSFAGRDESEREEKNKRARMKKKQETRRDNGGKKSWRKG
jgi:hypothetical protein